MEDLVGRLTLAEKVLQMKDIAPAIESLGIPAYNWWNEALHGVARAGLATSFPQAIGLAATGDDPKYFKTLATVKHYAVHSRPELDRHHFDAVVSERDLRESYLPHFELGIREGPAYSLMCAYNRVYGQAACGSDLDCGNVYPNLVEAVQRGLITEQEVDVSPSASSSPASGSGCSTRRSGCAGRGCRCGQWSAGQVIKSLASGARHS